MHSSTRAQPISSFHSTNPLDPHYLTPEGTVIRDISDYLETISTLFRSAMYQLSGTEKHKLIRFLGESPHADVFETIKGVGAYGRFYLCMSRTMGSNNLIYPIATAYEPPTTAQKVAAKLNPTVQPDYKLIPPIDVVRDLLPHAIWRCAELAAVEHFEGGIDVKIEQAAGISQEQMRRRERF